MTAATGGNAPSGSAGLQIHKVLSRGAGTEAQVLLVLVSAPVATADGGEPDLWVSIGRKAPDWFYARVATGDGIESARRLDDAELQALDLDRGDGERAFGLPAVAGRACFLARFDFSDHPYVRGSWSNAVQDSARGPASVLDIVCWRVRPGFRLDNNQWHESFEPLPGSVYEAVSVANVVSQPAFDLGVLFVHGIGSQGERETLVRWSEPIVKFWRDRARAITQAAIRDDLLETRLPIRKWVQSHSLRSRQPIDGIADAVSNFAKVPEPPAARDEDAGKGEVVESEPAAEAVPPPPPPAAPVLRPTAANPAPCCATAKPEQTLFPHRNPGAPSATLVRLSSLDRSATLRESHVLFAEAAWAQEAFPPTPDELYAWLTESIPIAVWARLSRLAFARPAEIGELSAAAKTPFERFRVRVAIAVLFLQLLFLPTAYVLVALASQVVLSLIGVIGLLPIPWLGRGIRWIVSVLMGTLGQSYALQTSSIRRSAIVSAVAMDLDWLSERSQHVVVMSHSQGAEISRLAFLESRRSKIARWYTFGAGIAPLSMLSPKSLDTPRSKNVINASKALLTAALAGVFVLAVSAIPGTPFDARDALVRTILHIDPLRLALAWGGLSLVLVALCGDGPSVLPQLRRSLIEKWTDLYGSEDPVAGGSLFRRWRDDMKKQGIKGYEESRLFNTRFAIFDHTTYHRNIEQFVAPIALALLRYAGLGSSEDAEKATLATAAERRDRRTWWNLTASTLASAAGAAALLWIAFGPPGRAIAWFAEASDLWKKDVSTWERLSLAWNGGFVGMLARDLWVPALLFGMMFLAWDVSRRQGKRSAQKLIDDLAATMPHEPAQGAIAPSQEKTS